MKTAILVALAAATAMPADAQTAPFANMTVTNARSRRLRMTLLG